MSVVLANPRGFCAGVDRAIDMVDIAITKFGAPIYVRHEIVHNTHVVADLRSKGAVFIEDLTEVPTGSVVIFSAHGVSKAVAAQAKALGLTIFDATCPLVTKVHVEVDRLRNLGYEIVMIGHEGHPEVEGTLGQSKTGMHLIETVADVAGLQIQDPNMLSYVTQTTLSVDDTLRVVTALKTRFPNILPPRKDDICYATQNRQDAVKHLADKSQVIFIVGSKTSSNANRLREVAEIKGVPAYLIDDASELKAEWLIGKTNVGVSAGASTPELLVTDVVKQINHLQPATEAGLTELAGVKEDISFRLPAALID
jgi:4-hydroxy-3-methylbut-2-en-1-yl diphosphate reductase